MKYTFADMVVVEESLIGVVVKCWLGEPNKYDVYVRNYNDIKTYPEGVVERYMVRHKYLDKAELEYQRNAIEGY